MPYTTVNLRGKDRDIEYRILSIGPGSGWEWDYHFTDHEDRDEFNSDHTLTAEEDDTMNKAIANAEGNTY